MRIVDVAREKTVPISSPIRNAYIDFSKMTLSVVAVVTDVIRDLGFFKPDMATYPVFLLLENDN